jgi:hypothetical protein
MRNDNVFVAVLVSKRFYRLSQNVARAEDTIRVVYI